MLKQNAREVALDVETTGLNPNQGDRIIEIACVELKNFIPTGRILHHFINPQRQIGEEATRIHGITNEMVAGKKIFADLATEIADFIGGSRLIIHNAEFDLKFLNYEYGLLKNASSADVPFSNSKLPQFSSFCTLKLARKKFPGSPATLDALCKRFNIDASHREKHNALIDTKLLAEVYLELMGGVQVSFNLGGKPSRAGISGGNSNNASNNNDITGNVAGIAYAGNGASYNGLSYNRASHAGSGGLVHQSAGAFGGGGGEASLAGQSFPKRLFEISAIEAQKHQDFIEKNLKDAIWLKIKI